MSSLLIPMPEKVEGRPLVHRVSLSFVINEQNRKFDNYRTERSLTVTRGSLLLAVGLYICFAWLDPMVMPDVVSELMTIRIFSCLLFGAGIALTYTQWGIRNFQLLMNLVVLVAGCALIRMVMIAESAGGYSYYAGIILAIM